ncbi:MAG: hypothetical protein LAT68_04205 [Cyclobacteriaceae bacterium]|nr:hypothetical protein [Cyclobacteriaceae bacterium]MCH8515512.1 hypothetical protein [Cyclobacteriaceae bacterium]
MKVLKIIYELFIKLSPIKGASSFKVFALCFMGATTFWFFNALNKNNYETVIAYPIHIVWDEADVITTNDLPRKVKLNVNGGGWSLLRKTVFFQVDPIIFELSNPLSTTYLTASQILEKANAEINDLTILSVSSLDTLKLSFERKLEKKVPIYINKKEVSLAKLHVIHSKIKIEPDSIAFTGPESFIKDLKDSIEIFIPKSNISSNFREEVEVFRAQNNKYVNVEPEEVLVSFEVLAMEEKEIKLPLNQKAIHSLNLTPIDTLLTVQVVYPSDSAKVFSDNLLSIDYENVFFDQDESLLNLGLKKEDDFILIKKIYPVKAIKK